MRSEEGGPGLVLGPLLRYASETEATIWVETDRACEVEVLGSRARTWEVEGHHFAILCIHDLQPGTRTPYAVALDGDRRWPEDDDPGLPPLIRTLDPERGLRFAFGSCRVSIPHEPPYALRKDDDDRGREVDALLALARQMEHSDPGEWPDALLLLGDQVYADEVSPGTRALIDERRPGHERRDDDPPGHEVADFEEYTSLYRDSWGDPAIRHLLATLPTTMIFDDHDVRDDWNISASWVQDIRREPWWQDRIEGAYMSYWCYQHLGNLSPAELAQEPLLEALKALPAGSDGAPLLRAFARRAQEEIAGTRWSFHRDFGDRVRLVMLDSRAGRMLEPGRRQMLSDEQWAWVREHARGDRDHLLIGTSLPWIMSPGLHHVQAWNEAVCDGAWGRAAAWCGERLRRAVDLEHWAAFGDSFRQFAELVRDVGSGKAGSPPASIVVLSGDVHHAYLAELGFPREAGVQSAVVQAVCSPIRNPLDHRERRAMRIARSRVAALIGRGLARAAGVAPPPVGWRLPESATFDNQIGTLELRGRRARVRIEKTEPEEHASPRLHATLDRWITAPPAPAGDAAGSRVVSGPWPHQRRRSTPADARSASPTPTG